MSRSIALLFALILVSVAILALVVLLTVHGPPCCCTSNRRPQTFSCWLQRSRGRHNRGHQVQDGADSAAQQNKTYLAGGDSWRDLESIATPTRADDDEPCRCEHAQGRDIDWEEMAVRSPEPAMVWHPSRASRLAWSFSPTMGATDDGPARPGQGQNRCRTRGQSRSLTRC